MQNEQIQTAIRTRAKDILSKSGIELPELPETETAPVKTSTRDQTEKKKGPPDWAPAHGWRKKFGSGEEEALGQHLSKKVSEGVHGEDLIAVLPQQIERVSKGGKVGEDVKGLTPSDKGKSSTGKSKSKGKSKK